MGVADYFQRATVAAAQAVAGFDETEFRTRIEQCSVGIAIGDAAASTPEGLALLDMSIRLIARLYPSVALSGPDTAIAAAAGLARDINPNVDIREGNADTVIVIGEGVRPIAKQSIFAGSHGWDAYVSTRNERSVASSANPTGAGAAACIAAAIVFRTVVAGAEGIDEDLIVSTLEMNRQPTAHQPELEATLDGDNLLVGSGAIGNAAIWTLARSPLSGTVHIIDPENIELSNIQRYTLAARADEGNAKIALAEAALLNSQLDARVHKLAFTDFVEQHGYVWDRALVALDSAAGRRQVQASLPRWTVNAWTQPGDLGVSTHPWRHGACLACLYLPKGAAPNEDELVASALGLNQPDERMHVRELLWNQQPPPVQLLERVASRLNLPLENLLPYADMPLRKLYVEGICGGAAITITAQTQVRRELHVPLAHQSALAGVLLAARAIGHALGATPPTSVATRLDLQRPVAEELTTSIATDPREICICTDRDYRQAYDRKYPA